MKENTNTMSEYNEVEHVQVVHDLKNSILIVSVIANLFVLTAWVAVQVTAQYDSQLATFLFSR